MNPLGTPVPGWTARPRPGPAVLDGRHVRLERLEATHAQALHTAFAERESLWDYFPYGPFPDPEAYGAWVASMEGSPDPVFYALCPLPTGKPLGVASFMRIAPEAGCIEVGGIVMAPGLQRTPAATEAMVLMMRWAFEAGYRRYEWKCDSLNAPSRRAAQRYGFSYEGTFRQALVVKGRNRDTAWFSIIDSEWPSRRAAFETWLAPENFDGNGRQRVSLSALTRPLLAAVDPTLA
jgi:RimJ/RimL family protein N-acetyltransferase